MSGSKDETPERRTASVAPAPAPAPAAAPAPAPITISSSSAAPASNPSTTVATTSSQGRTEGGADDYDDEPDETLSERLWGLTEMLPDPLRNFSAYMANVTASSVKGLYTFSCNASWIFFTSSVILFAPVIFETERAQMEEMQKSQQKQVLLGPGTAMAATGPNPALPLMR